MSTYSSPLDVSGRISTPIDVSSRITSPSVLSVSSTLLAPQVIDLSGDTSPAWESDAFSYVQTANHLAATRDPNLGSRASSVAHTSYAPSVHSYAPSVAYNSRASSIARSIHTSRASPPSLDLGFELELVQLRELCANLQTENTELRERVIELQ